MRPRDVIELLLLSVLWGGAYLFTRAAVPAFGPAPLVSMRLGIAALILLPIVLVRGGGPQLRANPVALFMVGVPYTALPFMLMTWGALHITAGLSAVLNATAPMFAALVAHFVLNERLCTWRAAGLRRFSATRCRCSSGSTRPRSRAQGPRRARCPAALSARSAPRARRTSARWH
jgi:drug/metabolite transporter (DMT)-like permease